MFNWLQGDLPNAKCLDLFSGSGALGIEALSRGAGMVKFIEKDKETAFYIAECLSTLEKKSARGEVVCADVSEWIQKSEEAFDIVFIDPPFNGDSIYKICHELEKTALAKKLIYLEWHTEINSSLLPKKWDLQKHKRSGSVFYALCLRY